jgi:DNA-binding CsgD family transcriptional regulator
MTGPAVVWGTDFSSAAPSEPFVGRERERQVLQAVVAAAAGSGAAAVILGEAGIGKSALLRHLAATSEHRVVWIRGSEAEAVLPFAAAAQLLTPLSDHLAVIPPAQRRALEIALAFVDGPAPNALAVCAGALNVLSAAGDDQPLVVLVDDLQWVDAESRQVLTFVGRRLSRERVALVMALRDEPGGATAVPDLATMRLGGLDTDDCRRLIRLLGLAASDHEIDAVADASGGSPLALIESLSRPRRAATSTGEPVVVVGTSVQAAWRRVLQVLPERTRQALFVVAVAGSPGLTSLRSLLPAMGLSLYDLDPAEQRGLVRADGEGLQLCYPLLGQVLMIATPTATRMHTYRTLASLSTPEQQPWYLSLAATEPDEELAQRLAEAACQARARAGHAAASRLMRRAADLTAGQTMRAQRLLDAATDALRGDRADLAASWARESMTLRRDATFLAAASVVCGHALVRAGQPRQAYDELSAMAAVLAQREAGLAAELLCEATMAAAEMGNARQAHRAAADAVRLAGGAPPPAGAGGRPCSSRLSARGRALAAAAFAMHGVPLDHSTWPRNWPVIAAWDQLRDEAGNAPGGGDEVPAAAQLADDPQALVQTAQVHLWSERTDQAHVVINAAVQRLRRYGAAGAMAVALAVRSDLGRSTGGWAGAYADARESLTWADESPPNGKVALGLLALARLEAVQGRRDLCEERIARCREDAGPFGVDIRLVYEPAVLGLAALTNGEHSAASELLETAWAQAMLCGLEHPNVLGFGADLAEAHVRNGNSQRALEIIAWLQERAAALGLQQPRVGAARCRGLLAPDPGQAQAAFAAAYAACEGQPMPFELARTLLCEGEVLRRDRQSAASRVVLRRAQHLFEGLGARPWTDHAAAELAAAGERGAARRAPGGIEALTPRQLQIARMVAAGRNNIETAAALFLSRKTVEAHLTHIYRKLGVRSRTQLTRALLAHGIAE